MKSSEAFLEQDPRLAYALHVPDQAVRGSVLVSHGFGEHSGRYGELVAALTARGLAVVTYDLRGHGRSGGLRGHVDAFDDYLRDADALLAALAGDAHWSAGGPPILFGHSVGGLISAHIALAGQQRFRALALTSPFFGIALAVPAIKLFLGRAVSRFAPRLTQPTGISGAQLTHDAGIAQAYDSDPLGLKRTTLRWFMEAVAAQEAALARAPELQLPLFCMVAGDDQVASTPATQRWFERVGSSDKQLRVIDGSYHEVLNETGRATVIKELCDRIVGWTPG